MGEQVTILGFAIMIFISVLVGVSLAPTIAAQVGTSVATEGITGTPAAVLLNLTILMYSLIIMLAAAAPTIALMNAVMG